MKTKNLLLAATIGLTLTCQAFAGDVSKIVESCTGCHGKDGVSADTNIPTIAGLSSKYLASNFKAYKAKERTCAETTVLSGADKDKKTDMCKVTEALTDAQVADLVKFYSSKKFVRATQKADAALAAKGKDLHKTNCEKCHSDGGANAADDASILAGQQMGYLASQFKDLMAGKRPMEKKMKAKIEALTQEDFDALTAYYGSMK